jgi:uncharacterized DUF497 family protein
MEEQAEGGEMKDDVYYKDKYVWNRLKNEQNKAKHYISFETASEVFNDPFYKETFDELNSIAEDRYNITGVITGLVNGLFVTVSITYRGDLIRIFSAREAEPPEIRSYYDFLAENFG